MGVLRQHLIRIGQGLDDLGSSQVAVIGFPNTHTDEDHVTRAFGTEAEQACAPDYNLLKILKHLGHGYRVFDVNKHTGIEEHIDLNDPLPEDLQGAFDIVVDSSCLEHCFNVAQAFRNLCDMVRVGGWVTTVAPIYIFNHGYYNINPIMHQDGFEANGFEIVSQELITNDGFLVSGFSGKKSDVRVRTFVLTAARKRQQQPWIWPIQTHKGRKVY
jgi:SAM-dependent methyltransferase